MSYRLTPRRSTSTYGLIDGGRAGMVYVYIASFVGFFASVISMAEISSMCVIRVGLRPCSTI